jgi:hypothetical protein
MSLKNPIAAVGFALCWVVVLPVFALSSVVTLIVCALFEQFRELVAGKGSPAQESISNREIARRLCLPH